MLPTRDSHQTQNIYRLKVKGRKKIFHANNREKKAGVAVLVSDKIHFKIKKITKDTESLNG